MTDQFHFLLSQIDCCHTSCFHTTKKNLNMEATKSETVEKDICGTKKPFAFYTIVREEHFYLPLWCRYYGQYVENEDLHVIHHVPKNNERAATDNCCDEARAIGVQVYVEDQEFFSTRWIRDISAQYQKMLLKSYKAVVFIDVDEIICVHPDSGFANLGEFMSDFAESAMSPSNWRVKGYSLIHLPERGEPKIDLSKPLLQQRLYWYRDEYYDKPLVTKVPLHWCYGFHNATNANNVRHPHLIMIHLHQFDYEWYKKRHQRWAKEYKVAREDKLSSYNSHYRIEDEQKLHFQYYHHFNDKRRLQPFLIERWVRSSQELACI